MQAYVAVGANCEFKLFGPNSAKARHLSDSKNIIYRAWPYSHHHFVSVGCLHRRVSCHSLSSLSTFAAT
jgi:hypothetical protein